MPDTICGNSSGVGSLFGVLPIAEVINAAAKSVPGRLLVFFPGSTAVYVGNSLKGGFGVSGDGVDQDDMIAFLGVASVREGRGMMPRGMPTLAHLV